MTYTPATMDELTKYIDRLRVEIGSATATLAGRRKNRPILLGRPAKEVYVGVASIYRLSPCSEEEAFSLAPLVTEIVYLAPDISRQLPAEVDSAVAGEEEGGDGPF